MACTLPKIVGFYEWFEGKFGDLCKAHDDVYVGRSGSKFKADVALSAGMWGRGYRVISIATFIFSSTIGWWYWIKD